MCRPEKAKRLDKSSLYSSRCFVSFCIFVNIQYRCPILVDGGSPIIYYCVLNVTCINIYIYKIYRINVKFKSSLALFYLNFFFFIGQIKVLLINKGSFI